MKIVFLLWFVVAASGVPPALIWMDKFDLLDEEAWTHMVTAWGGGNEEFQYYRNNRNNSFVEDGMLHIRPTFTADELGEDFLRSGTLSQPGCNYQPCHLRGNGREIVPPIFSARISTAKSFSFKYGKVEVRAKMPRGDWIWPAIWLMPEGNTYGTWPAGGEMDMVEIRANRNYTDQAGNQHGAQRMGSAIHFGPRPGFNQMRTFDKLLEKGDFSDDFHTFGLDWSNNSICFTVDGEEVGTVSPPEEGFWKMGGFQSYAGSNNPWASGTKMAPFDQKFYIILNVAVGGRYFPDGWMTDGNPRPWSWNGASKTEFWKARKEWEPTWDRPEMIVDHLLVYGWD